MPKYKMSEIAVEITERENSPAKSSYKKFVGLEHYDSGEVRISKFGDTSKLESTMKVFQEGDVLIARRNVYLKRAGVVNFSGLTSGDSIVLRPKNDIFGKILPFILNTEEFWHFAEQYSDGTMSKRLSPKILMEYEFVLPEEKELETLCDTLWAAYETKESYYELLKNTDELVKSQFIEMFGDCVNGWKHNTVVFDSIAQFTTGGTPAHKDKKEYVGDIPWVTTVALGKNYIYKSDAVSYISQKAIDESATHLIDENSLMIGIRVGVGKASVNKVKMCTSQDVLSVHNINSKYNVLFLKAVTDSYSDFFDANKRGATIKGIPSTLIRGLSIPDVDRCMQDEYVNILTQTDKSKVNLQKGLKRLENTKNMIIQSFSNERRIKNAYV